jgi:hypothetical protein
MNRRAKKTLLLALAALMWFVCGHTQHALNRDRAALGLTLNSPLENAPPVLAFTTVALGGFRGLIANVLWIRANQLQQDGKYFELVQLADWITKLQPRSAAVWRYQAWNMAYNVAVKFKDPEDRWRWVRRGIELLRDEGLAYNPRSTELHHELAWYFQNKLGYVLDDTHAYYKLQWSHEMIRIFGMESGDYSALLDPKTEDDRRRATLLREQYKLDPKRMKTVDERFGPLDWRLPETHAIYWAVTGLEMAGGRNELPLRRVIWQSMQTAFLRGRLIPVPALKYFELGPNLPLLTKANATYERMQAEMPEQKDAMRWGHVNFLREAVFLLYAHNRRTEAELWFRKLGADYPDTMTPLQTLDDFAVARFEERLAGASVDRIRATIEGLIYQAYTRLAIGEEDEAAGAHQLARVLWQKHQTKFANQQQRVGLPPLEFMQRDVRDRLLAPHSKMPPQLQAQLRTALNLPAATNAPPAVPAPAPP